MYLF
jgi:hypothetical protein